MATERTFSIIKPDATARNLTGQIIARFEEAGLRIVASKRIHMTREQAEGFYAVHKERPFFNDLVSFMISVWVAQRLRAPNGIVRGVCRYIHCAPISTMAWPKPRRLMAFAA